MESGFTPEPLLATLGSAAVLGGTYLALYLISRGKWVGSGDPLLALAIGLALMSPWLSLITLFVANLLATIVMLPTVIKSTKLHQHNSHQIYLGPFLVAGFIIVYALAEYVIIKI